MIKAAQFPALVRNGILFLGNKRAPLESSAEAWEGVTLYEEGVRCIELDKLNSSTFASLDETLARMPVGVLSRSLDVRPG